MADLKPDVIATTSVVAAKPNKRAKMDGKMGKDGGSSSGSGGTTPGTEDRTGLCAATLKSNKLCRRKATQGFAYCGYHLPLDPTSGYMYCTHVHQAGGRFGNKACGNPVLKGGDGLCKYHKPDGSHSSNTTREQVYFADDDDDDDDE